MAQLAIPTVGSALRVVVFAALAACGSVVSGGGPGAAPAPDATAMIDAVAEEPRGFAFSGSYRANPDDVSGIRVCDYPSLAGCTTDADGKSKGRARFFASGLDPAARVHRLHFDFQSNGYLTRNPGAHFAVGTRGRITLDGAGDPISVNGRGFIIGDLGADPRNAGNPACASRMVEIESYTGDAALANPAIPANRVFHTTCSDSIIHEGTWYTFELYVSSDRRIGYKIADDQGRLIQALLFQDPTDLLDPTLSDVFFGHVFDTRITAPAGDWSFIVRDVQLEASATSIDEAFAEPLMGFRRGAYALADDALVHLIDLGSPGLSVGDFPPARRRVFGCATTSADPVGCREMNGFRVIDFTGDPSFTYDGTRLRADHVAFGAFPDNTYRLIIRVNPGSDLVQTRIQIAKP